MFASLENTCDMIKKSLHIPCMYMRFHIFLPYSGCVKFSLQIYGNLYGRPYVITPVNSSSASGWKWCHHSCSSITLCVYYTCVFGITKYVSYSELNRHTVILCYLILNGLKDLFADLFYGLESFEGM